MFSDDDYEKLIDNVYTNLPEKLTKTERFEMPKFEFFTEGNKTIIKNFKVVSDKIRRDQQFVAKHFSKELAVPVEVAGDRLILQRKIMGDMLNKKLEEFVSKFVVCKQCNRPDTNIQELGHGLKQLMCESCGARTPIR
ncbi:translation initiation factor IF-2 subunit beta [Candidatus Micrarchaeota archaeon]|nr:translation initiation factor IF-2 subunit beta [Candidatus Micrarchaeota archaeon]